MSRLELTAWELTDVDGDGVCRVQLLQIWAGEAEYSSTAHVLPHSNHFFHNVISTDDVVLHLILPFYECQSSGACPALALNGKRLRQSGLGVLLFMRLM